MNESHDGKVSSLTELPREIAPPRDLWPGLEARLKEEGQAQRPKRTLRFTRELAAAAALIVAVAVGVGIGRVWSPHTLAPPAPSSAAPGLVSAALLTDPRYVREHEALLKALPKQLEALPPRSRAKVAASLATIEQSMQDIQAALGRDPANALLEEMLVNTYQDEMRVLADVQEANAAGREI